MAKSASNSQGYDVRIPAMVVRSTGRHRAEDVRPALSSHGSTKSSGVIPTPVPPHPALESGGWYQKKAGAEEVGPGRYPIENPADRSVGAALTLSLVGGPLGLFYTSIAGGLVCTALTAAALLAIGPGSLLVIWPLVMLIAWISANQRHSRY